MKPELLPVTDPRVDAFIEAEPVRGGRRCKDEGMPFADDLPAPPCRPFFVLPQWAE